MSLLEVRELETRFFTRIGVVSAVNGISFKLEKGETLGIVGESGSGKSITVLSILRLIKSPPGKITGGEVIFDGEDLLKLDQESMRKIRGNKMAMIFQDPSSSLNPVLTIGRQLMEGLQVHLGMSYDQARERAIALLGLVGIPDALRRLKSYPYQFSGGMRQRVMIAMALACNPKLLIADEPTTALDVTIQAQIVELMKNLRHQMGMSMIWITHDLGLLAGLADRIMVMYAGQVVEMASVDQLYKSARHPYTVGLLNSLPRLDQGRLDKLPTIEGIPPDLTNYPVGCPFAVRCNFAQDICRIQNPVLEQVDESHAVACWYKD